MRISGIRPALLLSLLSLAPAAVHAQAIYGRDNRKDMHQVSDGLKELSRSVAALFESSKVTVEGDIAHLATEPLSSRFNMHPDEPFVSQASGANCTGFLVAPDVLVSAAHCFKTVSCEDQSFVFDFSLREATRDLSSSPAASVFRCAKLLAINSEADQDWAIVKLDREATGRKPLELETSLPSEGTRVFTIGHPMGLPAKYAGAAVVRRQKDYGFTASVDAFGGNSGGPVFSSDNRKVLGILVRTDPFLRTGSDGQARALLYAEDAGGGTHVIAARRFAATAERKPVIGRADAERMQERLEKLALEIP